MTNLKYSVLIQRFLKLFLFFLVSFCVVYDSQAGQDLPEFCKDYLQNGELAGVPSVAHDRIPYGTGLLWKITASDGRESHVFGTMHSQDRQVTGLPPPVRLALAQSRRLVMEIIPDEHANQVFSEAIYYMDGTRLDSLLNRDIYQTLVQKLPPYGIAEEQAPQLKPWAAFTLIGRPRPVRAQTQDEALLQVAAGKPVAGLETMEELVSILDGISRADQITILNDTVCNHALIIRNTRELVQLYVARDLAGMVLFNEQPHHDEAVFNRFMQRIVYDRNQRMLERMEQYLREGGAFISVGASHLPGEKGILQMLEKKGYKITLVY